MNTHLQIQLEENKDPIIEGELNQAIIKHRRPETKGLQTEIGHDEMDQMDYALAFYEKVAD